MEPRSTNWTAAPDQFRTQWVTPGDVFSVLLILGADVIQLALAATSGARPFTPIAFSFGWVAYGLAALLGSLGENRLIRCAPEISLRVFNLKSGYARENHSWLLARLFRTYSYWRPKQATDGLRITLKHPNTHPAAEDVVINSALCVAIYKLKSNDKNYTSKTREGHVMTNGFRSTVWWSGIGTSALQLGVAAIPFSLYHDWAIFMTTGAGTILAYITASLPQWALEKWHARETHKDVHVALTTGNGSQEVIIVHSEKGTLDLEDLASGRAPGDMASTRVLTVLLAVLWIVLLITCTGIKENTWFLLAVGGLGILHNLIVATVPCFPTSLGLPLDLKEPAVHTECKVMFTLMELELAHPGHGQALRGEFFPGKLWDWEQTWWDSTDMQYRREKLDEQKQATEMKLWKRITSDKKNNEAKVVGQEHDHVQGDFNV
ncbi:hypothetical protein G7Z17_g770 [Cylindrodendrum hubeiense]|uniref:Uncharacterized protein n=1 Tax=Cylindrodendrum hubeiense TaxID=595255 RepID=A0A9P5HG38_9HYPO|nr:hypothetical protein G7Z17_g770 [Cylindrodendrum hubeiense]